MAVKELRRRSSGQLCMPAATNRHVASACTSAVRCECSRDDPLCTRVFCTHKPLTYVPTFDSRAYRWGHGKCANRWGFRDPQGAERLSCECACCRKACLHGEGVCSALGFLPTRGGEDLVPALMRAHDTSDNASARRHRALAALIATHEDDTVQVVAHKSNAKGTDVAMSMLALVVVVFSLVVVCLCSNRCYQSMTRRMTAV